MEHALNPSDRASAGGIVVTFGTRAHEATHEAKTREAIAAKLARIKSFDFAGVYDPTQVDGRPVYIVPSDTLLRSDAERLGIRGEDDLFGGVVPNPFAATKTITHPLVDRDAHAPSGWSHAFAERVDGAVLRGFTAFSRADAHRASARLLDHGPARIKLACGIGGHGQFVVQDGNELERLLASIDDAELALSGLVLEEHLDDVTTHSVGQVRVAGMIATYWGTQRLTRNNRGAEVYGGSDLTIAHGNFDALRQLPLSTDAQLAVSRAIVYDGAADACFPGFFASRRNYDVVEGTDARGRRRAGVLEQSWRIGGASAAEIEALIAFQHDPALAAVHASTIEIYGESESPPRGAIEFFAGLDERVGAIAHYVTVEPYGDPR
jgi:uncharacterized protein DUF3182